MNPYAFVPVDWNAGVQRSRPAYHDHFQGLAGRIEGNITTLTPLLIPNKSTSPTRFLRNRQGEHIIPATSLKGMVRSLVETIGPGCWWLYSTRDHNNRLPRDFSACTTEQNLCIACRMFGLIHKQTNLLGHVGFEDAICTDAKIHKPFHTIILSGPKPRHTAFYQEERGERPAGRKFYFHHSEPPRDVEGWLPKGKQATQAQNQYIQPLEKDNTFKFSANFQNLALEELQLLLYALVLEPSMRHKIGYAKPAGLGSVKITLSKVELIDYQQRYTNPAAHRTLYTEEDLTAYLSQQTRHYATRQSPTLEALRDIWGWPGRDDLRYPDRYWFDDYPQVRLDQTP